MSANSPSVIDVTDATFQTEVIERSMTTPVVIDLWAEWCGPCKTLGPILEAVVGETDGKVVLAKVDVDTNPQVAGAFKVQSIPAVFAVKDGAVVDGFVGAYPEHTIREFVASLMPSEEDLVLESLIAVGDEDSLRKALEMDPGHEDAICTLAELLVETGRGEEALALLARIPETERTRHIAAAARVHLAPTDDYDAVLTDLLDKVKGDDEARQQFVDILELMGPHDPRTAVYRKQLTGRLY